MKRWFLLALLAGLATVPFLKRKRGTRMPVLALTPDVRYDIEDFLGDQL
jgi:hypothetical protein